MSWSLVKSSALRTGSTVLIGLQWIMVMEDVVLVAGRTGTSCPVLRYGHLAGFGVSSVPRFSLGQFIDFLLKLSDREWLSLDLVEADSIH